MMHRRLAIVATLACTVLLPTVSAAGPPVSLRGIDVPTVLSFYDRARRTTARMGHDAVESERSPAELATTETIVLDPGHGDGNIGAVGITGVAEKYLTLQLAYALRERLQDRFPRLRVVLTRYWDRGLGLDDRTHLANRIGADLFLSLHYNAASHQRAVGVETYFLATRESIPGRQQVEGKPIASTSPRVTGIETAREEERYRIRGEALAVIKRDLQRARQHKFSGMLAEIVQKKLTGHIETPDRGVKQANFAVLRGALMPAVVVEGGFMTHPEEALRIQSREHRRKLAESLVEAIVTFDRRRAAALDSSGD